MHARYTCDASFSTSRIRIAIFGVLVRAFLSLSRRGNVKGYTSKFGSAAVVAYFAAEVCNFSQHALQVHFRFPDLPLSGIFIRVGKAQSGTTRDGGELIPHPHTRAHCLSFSLFLSVNISISVCVTRV